MRGACLRRGGLVPRCLPPGGCVAAVLRPTAVWRGLADDDAGEVPNARLACSRSASPALA